MSLHSIENFCWKLFDGKIKCLRIDLGGEYKNLLLILNQGSVLFRHSFSYTYQQNRISKRKYRHIVEMGLTLLSQAQIPLVGSFLNFCFFFH